MRRNFHFARLNSRHCLINIITATISGLVGILHFISASIHKSTNTCSCSSTNYKTNFSSKHSKHTPTNSQTQLYVFLFFFGFFLIFFQLTANCFLLNKAVTVCLEVHFFELQALIQHFSSFLVLDFLVHPMFKFVLEVQYLSSDSVHPLPQVVELICQLP